MDTELKLKWVEALRSGKYKQGKQRFKSADDTYCCLGVLADVAGVLKGNEGLAGFVETHPITSSQEFKFWRMNDTEKKSFAEIADYIEANL